MAVPHLLYSWLFRIFICSRTLISENGDQGLPDLRGFTDNPTFANHQEPEIELLDVPDWKDATSTSSKKNMFEGYRTDNIIVLTPYLSQLRLLLDELGKENDPVLNDLDSHDLVRAGLMPAVSANYR
ncbi:hypothetical protein GQ44DRAFT_732824 [Phaeosphaeriaceae sp. PMI808]|nr:hypothetical protein GQ44DRAFT_732824 [Phaeosphaeriaceae sp. PMI808]